MLSRLFNRVWAVPTLVEAQGGQRNLAQAKQGVSLARFPSAPLATATVLGARRPIPGVRFSHLQPASPPVPSPLLPFPSRAPALLGGQRGGSGGPMGAALG